MQPLFALSGALRKRGHTVKVTGGPEYSEWAAHLDIDYSVAHLDSTALVRKWLGGDRPVSSEDLESLADEFHTRALPLQTRVLASLARDADIMVATELVAVGPSVAEATGIPYLNIRYHATNMASSDYCFFDSFRRLPKIVNRLSWKLRDYFANRDMRPYLNIHRRELGLPPLDDVWKEHFDKVQVLFAFDAAVTLPPSDLRNAHQLTGFWFLDDTSPLGPDLEAFLGDGAPPIFVGFGSMPTPRSVRDLVMRVARARGERVILASGLYGLAEGIEGERDVFILDRPAAHAILFPRVAALIHHGGAGTTSTAMRAGVPQVVISHAWDQYSWGQRVHALGVGGSPLEVRTLEPEPLRRAMDEALATSPERRGRLAAHLRENDGLGRTVQILEQTCQSRP